MRDHATWYPPFIRRQYFLEKGQPKHFSHLFEYLSSTEAVVDRLTMAIEEFVAKELDVFEGKKSVPLSIFIALTLFVPVVIYITLHTTTSMLKGPDSIETYFASVLASKEFWLEINE